MGESTASLMILDSRDEITDRLQWARALALPTIVETVVRSRHRLGQGCFLLQGGGAVVGEAAGLLMAMEDWVGVPGDVS